MSFDRPRHFGALLEYRDVGRVIRPNFADDVELGIFIQNRFRPASHEALVIVRIGVFANSVNAAELDPPQRILNQVIRQEFVALVEIRHTVNKPESFEQSAGIFCRSTDRRRHVGNASDDRDYRRSR